MDTKAPDAFRTISEVAEDLDLPQHVLRFWESRFHEIKPMKRGGGRRYYRPDDIDLLRGIRHLLYGEGYTIRGVQRILREQGSRFVQAVWQEGAPQPPHGVVEGEAFVEEVEVEVEETEIEETVLADEGRGLRGRLSSLIGRDLGERQDDAAARSDPPLTSAPMPRVDAVDRAMHGADASDPTGASVDTGPVGPRKPSPPSAAGGLAGEDLRKLRAVLHDLTECRKLIDAVVTRPH
ncbi:MAG TPA: MerR family transcriptional regulator [Pseudolabrys sp.]|nr:MerR family transcriptional regulator [Pseudolabrys sp.]